MGAPDPMRVQCSATSKVKGKRCGRTAIPGGTVCRYHGGAAPQVRAAAAERLKALQIPSIGALEDALTADKSDFVTKDGEVFAQGPDHAIRVKASQIVLDRTGLGPHSTVNVEGSLGERLAALDGHDSD